MRRLKELSLEVKEAFDVKKSATYKEIANLIIGS